MRAILKATGERGVAWLGDDGAWWFTRWDFTPGAMHNTHFNGSIVRRSDLVLLPGSGEGVGR